MLLGDISPPSPPRFRRIHKDVYFLKQLIQKATGLPASALRIVPRPPIDIQSNRLYDVWAGDRRLIAKEYLKPNEFDEAPFREFNALERLAALDIAPQPVYLHPEPTPALGPVVFYEFMAGQMWDRYRPTATELGQLADLWLKMNTLPTAGLWMSRGQDQPLADNAANFRMAFEKYGAWADHSFAPGRRAADLCLEVLACRQNVVRQLDAETPVFCFCRSDARFANVIARPDGRLGLVDWEDSGLRDPARDLADLMIHANQEDLLAPDEWQAFLQPYLAVRGQKDPHLAQRTHLYLALFPIFWLKILIGIGLQRVESGRLSSWQVNGLPPNERLRRYLARSLAWPEHDFSRQLESVAEVQFFPNV